MNRTQTFGRAALRDALSLTILVLSISVAMAGNLYKWTDETGEVHYSDRKPSVKKWERVNEGNVSTIPNDVPAASAVVPQPVVKSSHENQNSNQIIEREFIDRRLKLIDDCERNRGVDCARQVDTELGAERIQASGHVIHQASPSGPGVSSR